MIEHYPSFFNKKECSNLIDLFSTNKVNFWEDNIYTFYSVDLKKSYTNIPKFKISDLDICRVQMVDGSIDQVKNFHLHTLPIAFVIFLNEDFKGGELIFSGKNRKNEIEYRPKTGDMVYFSGNEPHRVADCIGKRYTLVGFAKNDIISNRVRKII